MKFIWMLIFKILQYLKLKLGKDLMFSKHNHKTITRYCDSDWGILRYLKLKLGKGLKFSKHNHKTITRYCNWDWGAEGYRQCSTTGYFTFLEDNLVSWKSKKQKFVLLEAEYREMIKGTQELLQLEGLTGELCFFLKGAMKLYCDNQ